MDVPMKPVRIPSNFTNKYLQIRLFRFLVIWFAIVFTILLLHPSDKILLVFIGFWIFSLCAASFYPIYFDIVLFPEGVQVRVLGKVIRQIPVSEFKLLCAVRDDRGQSLCLSKWTVEELAMRREEILRKGYFSRQDLPFMKRKPDWQEHFAKEYLLHPKRLPRGFSILWLPVDPVVAIYLRRLYPQLPYLDVRSNLAGRMYPQSPDQIPFYFERYRADEEGMHILRGRDRLEIRCIPADKIKTIVRVDRFTEGTTIEPSYGIYLVVSELSLAELAEKGKQKGWSKWKRRIIEQLPEAEEMYAAEFHFSGLFTWNWKTSPNCHIRYTPEAENLLRQLYPHAQWVDYSNKWL